MTTKSHAVSFRLNPEVEPIVKKWLTQHPGISMSSLANLAIKSYVSKNQVLEAVETVYANKKNVNSSLQKLMKKHKKTLDELK